MFLARVLTGRSAQSSPAYRRPPKDKRTGRLFDSVSNGTPVSTAQPGAPAGPHATSGTIGFGGGMPAVGVGGAMPVLGFGGGWFGGMLGRRTKGMHGTEYGVEVLNNKQNQAAVYVIFDPMQHYPEYVVSY